jgi:hypothetical protein
VRSHNPSSRLDPTPPPRYPRSVAQPHPTPVPRAAPTLIALVVGLGASLPLLGRSLDPAGRSDAWLLAWLATALLTGASAWRDRLPGVPGAWPGFAWLVAAVPAAALLGRHGIDSLSVAAAELPLSSGLPLGLDLGDALLLLALLVLTTPQALRAAIRGPRPGLALPALVAVGLLAALLGAAGWKTSHQLPSTSTSDALALLPACAALAWTGALLGPAALALDPRQRLLHRALPTAALVAIVAALPALLALQYGAALQRADGVLLSAVGRRAFGPYGDRVGAGFETLICLAGLLVLLTLIARIAARRLAGLRGWILPALAVATTLAAATLSTGQLVVAAAVTGWFALLLGRGADPLESEAP